MTDLTLPDPTPDDGDDAESDVGGGADPGGFDMGALLEQAMGMQQQLMEAQAEAADALVEGQAGGGVVRIEVTGGMEFRSVTIAPEAVDPGDVELLEDLVLAALNDAMAGVARLQQQSMGGLDLGAMGDMLGLGGPAALTDDVGAELGAELEDDDQEPGADLEAELDAEMEADLAADDELDQGGDDHR
jgi:DNA-binding YbaB/EbfC family protein